MKTLFQGFLFFGTFFIIPATVESFIDWITTNLF